MSEKDCEDCPHWEKELQTCNKVPSKLKGTCLLRHIAFTLTMVLQELQYQSEDDEDISGEEWKYNG